MARAGGGPSGGYRTLIAYRTDRRSVFIYGFAKSERDNINPRKLAVLKTLARHFMSLTDGQLARLLNANSITEIDYHDPEEDQAQEVPQPAVRGDPRDRVGPASGGSLGQGDHA